MSIQAGRATGPDVPPEIEPSWRRVSRLIHTLLPARRRPNPAMPDAPRPDRRDASSTEAGADAPWWQAAWLQIKASLPTEAELSRHRWLRPIARRLSDRGLWRMKSEPVARGVAIGLFWAFAVPVAQVLFAAAHCVWWRGNIPIAAGVTLITNPLTVGGWLWLAYQVGSLVIESPGGAPVAPAGDGLLAWLGSIGAPTLLGMAIFAVGGAVLGYLMTTLAVRAWSWLRMRRALQRRAGRRDASPAR